MTLGGLAWANLRAAPMGSALNVLLMALGTASIMVLLLVGQQLGTTLSRDARGIDLVLGAKGSPVQLILSSVYHADVPTGNISQADAMRWADDARVARAVPLALGDSFRGFRIVGSTSEYLELYRAQLVIGRLWQAPMEAVLGSAVARSGALAMGAAFAGAHGLSAGGHVHDSDPYRVVGVLAETGTVLDRLILTSLDSVWNLHDEAGAHEEHDPHVDDPAAHAADHDNEHEHDDHQYERVDLAPVAEDRQITALLLRYASPLAATTLPQQINAQSSLQAASPAFEITRLLQLAGLGLDGLRAFAGVLIVTAGLSLFATLYGALKTRRYDLAMLRCLGATRGELLLSLLIEGLLLSLAGAVLGFALGHVLVEMLGHWLAQSRGVGLTGLIWLAQETLLLGGLLLVGLVAAALPAWQAYRVDVASILAEG
ncbi:FtsX-like permease family protein [Panacagrimonas sp.]|uniref:ABC transporter permease n=1 Tax=Panacagrimonas sp. TaxID=2480088 RepID=UPI003B5267F2